MTTIRISDRERGTKEVDAYYVGGGLAVTPNQATIMGHAMRGYTITHVRSGRAIGVVVPNVEEAVAALKAILPLADWTLPMNQIFHTVEERDAMYKAVRTAIEERT